MKLTYPEYVSVALWRLSEAGHAAYLVGGSLRDTLLGRKPNDFDVATSALPNETLSVFADHRVIETGLAHGTVTVLFDRIPVEITTFRIDGDYTDARHPDRVTFTSRIEEDLARRDFTVNAMAYHPSHGLVDPFGGRDDLARRLIRAVREPRERFTEDALRILRAFRFSAQLGFDIEEATLRGAAEAKDGLARIARERVSAEWLRLLCSPEPQAAIRQMQETGVLPFVVGDYTPSERILANLSAMPSEDVARLGFFFAEADEETLCACLDALRLSNRQKTGTRAVVRGASRTVETSRDATALIAETGVYAPLAARASVLLGHSADTAEALVSANRAPTSIKELAIGGRDVAALGLCGAEIGQMLSILLALVMEDPSRNDRATLLALVKEQIGKEAYEA